MATRNITRIPAFGPGKAYINAIVEAPRGSRIKFKYDEETGLFAFDKTLPLGQVFPFEFGFIPSTLGEDGDPLDVLIISDEATFVGCLVHATLLGVLEAEQTEKRKTERNDRLIALPIEVKTGKPAVAIKRIETKLERDIAKFFVAYNKLQGKEWKFLRSSGPERAANLIKSGMAQFRKEQRKA